MRRLIFLAVMMISLVVVTPAYGQSTANNPEEIAQKYNVTFPIADLGGCTDYASCRTFCEDPVNAASCINYAKSKGFYKEDVIETKKEVVLRAARQTLGCDSQESCVSFCSLAENHDKCDAFAKRQGLAGGRVEDPSKTQVIAKAKEILGCDSAVGCQSLCSQEENRQKCSDFARQVGLRGGERQVGPGGCNSEESCRSYCSDHEDECRGVGGPGGSPPPGYNPQEMCSRTPNCRWENDTCQCSSYGRPEDAAKRAEEYAKFCRENPDKCRPGQPGDFRNEKERNSFEDYCRQNPERCIYQGTASCSGPSGGCGSGYSWDKGTCTCKPSSGCPAGTSWNGSYCMKDSGPSGGGCSPPAGGCGSGWFDNSSCSCKPASAEGCYNVSASSCGSGFTWDASACTCRSNTPSGGGGSCGSGTYWTGSYCKEYSEGSTPAGGGGYTNTQTQYEDPATACARGTNCTWTGSSCNCTPSGGSSGSSTPAPEQPQQSTPQPEQPAPQPVPDSGSSGGSSGGSCPEGSYMKDGACVSGVQGVSTVRGIFKQLLDLFSVWF